MLNRFVDAFKSKDVRGRIFFTLSILLIYVLGLLIAVPGVKLGIANTIGLVVLYFYGPKEYVLILIDHISLISPEGGMDLRESINRLSEHMIVFRNRYNYTPVIIQQQGTETGNLDAFKNNKIRPTMAGLSDSKYTAKDASMMLGITNPFSHEIDNYLGYDIRKFKGNIRFLEVVLNREGQSNGIIALYFDGKTCTFKELPPPSDKESLDKVYKYLDKIRGTNKVFMFFNKLFNRKNG